MGELEPSEENIVKKKIMYEWMGNKKIIMSIINYNISNDINTVITMKTIFF